MLFRSVLRTARTFRPLGLRFGLNSINSALVVGSLLTPVTVRYTEQHEWLAVGADGAGYLGITKYAADALGDATYIEVLEAGTVVEAGELIGSVESVKLASEVYLPVNAEVLEANDELELSPQLINEDPMGAGWLAKVQLNVEELEAEGLMLEEAYEALLLEEEH